MSEAETKPTITEESTNQADSKQTDKEKEPSDREIAMHEKSQIDFMKKRMPFLEAQAKYTGLIAQIDENHCRRVEAQIRYANIMASQNKIKAERLAAEKAASAEGDQKVEMKGPLKVVPTDTKEEAKA